MIWNKWWWWWQSDSNPGCPIEGQIQQKTEGSDRNMEQWKEAHYLLILVMAFFSHFMTRKLDLCRAGAVVGVGGAAIAGAWAWAWAGTGTGAEEDIASDAAMELLLPTLLLRLIITIWDNSDASEPLAAEVFMNPPSPCTFRLLVALLCLFRIRVPSSATIMLSAHIRPDDPCLLYDNPFFSIAISLSISLATSRTSKL